MCAGAIVNARVRRVVYGAPDEKAGACGSAFNLFDYPLNHRPEICAGVLQEEASLQLKAFFSAAAAEKQARLLNDCGKSMPFCHILRNTGFFSWVFSTRLLKTMLKRWKKL